MKHLRGFILGVLVSLLFVSLPLRAQEVAAVKGVVLDKSNAPISGVEVTLDNEKVGLHLKTTTSDTGEYQFLRVAPGPGYTITFLKEGFTKLNLTDVYLGVNSTSTRNATLEIGVITQSVEVKATGEQTIDTTDATIGHVFGTDFLHSLPIEIHESPAVLLGLQPGVVPRTDNDASGNRSGAVTGARADQGNITLDGIDVNDQATGQAFGTVGNAPIDAIQEFRGITAGDTADLGRSSGAQIQLVTKSGGNDWHGSAAEYHRNTITTANSFFNNSSGVPRAALIRNQFGGSLLGPLKKDKLFFFFLYDGRRDAKQDNIARTVPLDHYRNGQVGYINNGNDSQGNPCTAAARLNNPVTAQCISFTPATGPNSLASLDPAGKGVDAALATFVNGRYPHANDLTAGDGINTGLVRFNAPVRRGDNTYVTRIDDNLTGKQRLFGRFNVVRTAYTDDVNFAAVQFPGDPAPAHEITVRDYTFVVGHTWTISANKINQAIFGIASSRLGFPSLAQQTFPNSYGFGPLSAPYSSLQSQFRTVPVPTLRDDFTWTRGKHIWQYGGLFKPSHQTSRQINDFNFVSLGLGGLTSSLDSASKNLRPSDILQDPAAIGEWDSTFPFILGRFASVDTNFNYTNSGNAQKPGSGRTRSYRYFEQEYYGQDQWHLTNSLTLTYGLRWQYYSVPYETSGLQSVPTVDYSKIFPARVQAGAAGISGSTAIPIVQYVLGGKGNKNGPGIYNPDFRNFSPRFALAYNPGFREGLLGHTLGDRKTSIRLGGTIVYDRVNANTINFIQDQVSYLFNNTVNTLFGGGDPGVTLGTDPRFTALGTLPVTNVGPPITTPFTPFVDSATGYLLGNAQGQFNYAVLKNFRTPLSYQYNLGVQRELPGSLLLDVSYVGRLGRKLFAQSDAAQLVDFIDPASKQGLVDAFNLLATQVRAGTPGALITPQPWFENQMNATIQNNFGLANCAQFAAAAFGANIPTCTRLVRAFFRTLISRGDLTDTLQGLYGFFSGPFGGLIPQNVGLAGQFSVNSYISNAGSSNYDAMLLTLTRRPTSGLQFQFNYTFSHSIDNVSTVANTVVGGLVCDVRNLRVCRGNSDFDVTHLISADGVYDLPFGKGRRFAPNVSGWLNQIIGGWQFGTIATWHTGFAFSTSTDAFPVNFFVNSPALLTGNASALASSIHSDKTGAIQMFANPTAALGAFSFTNGGQVGSRNTLRGPGFWNFDTRFTKEFHVRESHKLTFQWDAYNTFNHTTFADPGADINSPATFGQITSQGSANRVMQFGLRYDF
jgi:hypothetical protein